MKFYTKLLMSLIVLGVGNMHAVYKRTIELSNQTSGKLRTDVGVTVITTKGATSKATVIPGGSYPTLLQIQIDDSDDKIDTIITSRLKKGKRKDNRITNVADKINVGGIKRSLDALKFTYVNDQFTVEATNDNEEKIKLLP